MGRSQEADHVITTSQEADDIIETELDWEGSWNRWKLLTNVLIVAVEEQVFQFPS